MAEIGFETGALIENRYRVLSVIGSGGMGTLYRVSDEAMDGEMAALKTVRLQQDIEEPESGERFQREFQILTQLRHPNLVSVYDYGITTEGELYFTMEWIEGQGLASSMRQLERTAIVPVMVQVCRALAYLHARDVIHGDLKPSNVLMRDDQAKLVDFGVALETRGSEVIAHYHSPGYAAPEVRQQRPVDHRADLYSLGAMWYELLVGEPPQFMSGAERLIQFALDEVLEAQEQVPTEIGTVIIRLLATSPTDRYAGANEVIEAVNDATGSAYALETRETAISYALRGRFVGRDPELGVLQAMWEQARSCEGKLVLVSGEAGVGKTRLLEEFVMQAELEGARVARGQCVESGGSAYRPWREVLRVLIRYVEGADGTTLKRVGPVLGTLIPELWGREYMAGALPPADLDPQAAQRRLNDTIVQVLRAAARLRPTVIVIEDAQWADEATLALLSVLSLVPGETGLQVCITYRDEESDPVRLLDALSGGQVAHIPLRSLSPEVTTDLVQSMLGLEELPTSLTERVQRTTGGNAFFVQELIRSLAEDGVVLQRTVAGWQVDRAALQEARLPESIRQVVWRRVGHLPVETQQVLQWAAIVGPMFWDGLVEEISRVPRERVWTALREGVEQELVFERDTSSFEGEREFLFAKPAVQEVSYESVSTEERRDSHSRVAAWLMARSDESVGEHLGLIAGHLEGAGQTAQAATYLHRAGEQAAEQFAGAEAIRYFSHALELTPEEERTRRYRLLLAREKMYDLHGAREVQYQDLLALQTLAVALHDDRERAEVSLRQANYADATGDYPGAISGARAAIGLVQEVRDTRIEAAGHLRWGGVLWRQGDYDASRSQLERALALAQTASLPQAEADGLRNLGLVPLEQGDYAEGRAYFEQALRICREIGDRQGEGKVLNNLGNVCCYQGDYAEARAYYEQALRICREIGDRQGESATLGNLGVVFIDGGDYAGARDCFERALRIDREIGDRSQEGQGLSNLGSISIDYGDYAGARTYLEQALRIHREVGDPQNESTVLVNLGLLHHYLNEDEAARKYSQQSLLIAQGIGDRRNQGFALNYLGDALAGLGHLSEAAETYRQALSLRRELGEPHLAMDALAGLARVSLAQGDPIQAQAYVEEILRYEESNTLDAVEEPFQVYLTCTRVLRANQDPRAQVLLNRAHRLLQELAVRITDEEIRRSFLKNVAVHREIMSEFAL